MRIEVNKPQTDECNLFDITTSRGLGLDRMDSNPESNPSLVFSGQVLRHEFENDQAVEADVLGLVDHALPPPPNFSIMRRMTVRPMSAPELASAAILGRLC